MSGPDNGKYRAYPLEDSAEGTEWGLTKRELFAAMAMQALAPTYEDFCSGPGVIPTEQPIPTVGRLAVEFADGLLAALGENQS